MRRIISTFLWGVLFFLMLTHVYGADMAKAPAPASPSGFYVGGNLIGGLASDQTSTLSSGGAIGGQVGYQWWYGNYFAAEELFGDISINNQGPGLGYKTGGKFGEITKVGVGLGGLLGAAGAAPSAPSQAPVTVTVPTSLQSSLSAPYLAFGGVENVGAFNATGWAVGTGIDWAVAQHVNLDVMYLFVDYNSPLVKNENIVKLGLNYKF